MILVDLNILLYAVNRDSPEYARASGWLRSVLEAGEESVGLAWVVLLGFLRLASSPRLFPRPLTTDEASQFVDALLNQQLVRKVLPTEGHWPLLRHLLAVTGTGGNLVTNAHIAAFALEYNAKIATRDTDFSRFPGITVVRPF
ncbi:MAG TPA: TA system VapC family ribonuclease toxin [Spirochaetia bacterium]|nr:TA system VapC family ribonuclease toxin [Spirochaetia bacterium]